MHYILDTIEPIIPDLHFVTVDQQKIDLFVDKLIQNPLREIVDTTMLYTEGTEADRAAFSIVSSAIIFSTWGNPKWGVQINGKIAGGSVSVIDCLKRAIANDYPLLDPNYLEVISKKDVADIFKGNIEIPMLDERVKAWQDLGRAIKAHHKGSFMHILEQGKYDASGIVRVLAETIPSVFNDTALYNGHSVLFYKRAQLIAYNLICLHKAGLYSKNITGVGDLTAFADYKIPQMLRGLGIIVYNTSLANMVDSEQEILAGSDEEIEIRAATIWAVHKISQQAQSRGLELNDTHIDAALWLESQDQSKLDKPYHHTRTIWY